MKKKFTINPRLKTYSVLAGSFLAAGNAADASIIYHDVNPDATTTQTSSGTSTYAIDMDNNGNPDFVFALTKYTSLGSGSAVSITASNSNNGVVFTTKSSLDYAKALNINDNINSTLNWYSNTSTALNIVSKATGGSHTLTTGEFQNATDKYLGVKFTDGTNIHYGWIRIDVTGYNSVTVKDWAYENTPDQSIVAGQTVTTGINTYLNSATTIKNINNIIEAEFASSIQGKVRIVNISGTVVRSVDVNGNSCSLNMEGMPSGIYNVVVSAKEGTAAKKVFVE